jgi:hypothetical protein
LDDCDKSGPTGTLAVSRSGRPALSREQWKRLESGHRRRNQDTRRCHKQRTRKGRNGDTAIGYSGRTALRWEQWDGFAQVIAGRQPGGHVLAHTARNSTVEVFPSCQNKVPSITVRQLAVRDSHELKKN